jgi:uncharacterized protein
MLSWKQKYGSWGLVAGAAEGLGKAFSEGIARRGINLILVDRQEGKLYETAGFLEETYGISTKKLLLDLSETSNLTVIFESIEDIDCRLFIYNAAYGPVKPFLDHDPDELDYYINLNSRMPLLLIYHLLKNLSPGCTAGVILMSSLAGIFGTNLVAAYGATKAFNFNLGEALYHEFRGSGIDIMACCAGATDTPNYRDTKPKYGFIRPTVARPEMVAEASLKRLGKQGLYIPGWGNRLMVTIMSGMPRKTAAFLMNHTMKQMYNYHFE